MSPMTVKLCTDVPPVVFSRLFLRPNAPFRHSVGSNGMVRVVEFTTSRAAQGRSLAECLAALGVAPR